MALNSWKYLNTKYKPNKKCFILNRKLQDSDFPLFLFTYITSRDTINRTLLRKLRRETILNFYKIMALLLLLYSSETCTLSTCQLQRLEAAEMRLLRPLAG